jgi:hypothetical protein
MDLKYRSIKCDERDLNFKCTRDHFHKQAIGFTEEIRASLLTGNQC